MHTKLTKLVFSQLGKRRNLRNLRFQCYTFSVGIPQGFRPSLFIPLNKTIFMLVAKQLAIRLWTLKCNKTQPYTRLNALLFKSVKTLMYLLLKNCKSELAPAADAESFRLGYMLPNLLLLTTDN